MLIDLVTKDERKHLLCKSAKKNIEIYCYEESNKSFSVCLLKDNQIIIYGAFSFIGMAKQMGYWLAAQLMDKEYVATKDFIKASLENGTHKCLIFKKDT